MAMNNAYLTVVATAGSSAVTHVSLANGPAEGNELGVTRQPISWNVTDGNVDSSNTPVFDVTGGSTVNHVQFWSAATGGTFYGASAVTEEVFSGDGTYTVSDADINHNAA